MCSSILAHILLFNSFLARGLLDTHLEILQLGLLRGGHCRLDIGTLGLIGLGVEHLTEPFRDISANEPKDAIRTEGPVRNIDWVGCLLRDMVIGHGGHSARDNVEDVRHVADSRHMRTGVALQGRK